MVVVAIVLPVAAGEVVVAGMVVDTVVSPDCSWSVVRLSEVDPEEQAARSEPATSKITRRRTNPRYPPPRLGRVKVVGRSSADCLYNHPPVSDSTLYFAYTALLDPDRMGEIAPGASFRFTAHYPETRLGFVDSNSKGAIPTLSKDSEHTVWGGVFEIPSEELAALVAAEKAEGRHPGFEHKAVDREGNKHDCLTFVAAGKPNEDSRPSPEYLESMIRGARHWNLPAGWVMGLQDLTEDPLFS